MALYRDVPFEEVPLDGMRKTIATRLVQAKQTIPHFYLTADVEIGRLLAMREEANAVAPKDKDGNPAFQLSVNDFIIKAWAAALAARAGGECGLGGRSYPALPAVRHRHRGRDRGRPDHAGDPPGRDQVAQRDLRRDARARRARARAQKLKPNEYQGGSSAISNLGMYGVREFAAIINPPHATILAVGAARRQAVEKADGGVGFASVMTVTLSCDHRVVDGALGAELARRVPGLHRATRNDAGVVARLSAHG